MRQIKVGIEAIGVYTPGRYLDLVDLANARQEDPNKYLIGIGQHQMAVIGADQDAVTMGAAAGQQALNQVETSAIEEIVLATESGIDQSKAGAIVIANLLGLAPQCRAFDVKEACYGGTAALRLAQDYVLTHPQAKVLVIASDIARYGLATPGEVTQGAGAVAMVVSAQPKLAVLHTAHSFYQEDIMDFWRPNYLDTALADGAYSKEQYLHFFNTTWESYCAQENCQLDDFAALLFHIPYTKLGRKALALACDQADPETQAYFTSQFDAAIRLNQQVGNLYTGSLYLSLVSWLAYHPPVRTQTLGMFSYGSGAMAEFFTLTPHPQASQSLPLTAINNLLAQRQRVSVSEYEQLFKSAISATTGNWRPSNYDDTSPFHLIAVDNHQRLYE